jgi:hypothetical protein
VYFVLYQSVFVSFIFMSYLFVGNKGHVFGIYSKKG